MKISELKDLVTKVVKEMSGTSGGDAGGANVTGNGTGEQTFTPVTVKKTKKAKQEVKDVEPKLAAGKVKNNYYVTHFGYTPAPSVPNRKSKAMDYKKIWEVEKDHKFEKYNDYKVDGEEATFLAIRDGKAVFNIIKSGKTVEISDKDLNRVQLEMNEMNTDHTKVETNAEELARVEGLLAKAHQDKAYSVMSAYEFRIKALRLLVGLEKKYNTTLPLLKFGTMVGDYLNEYFPGFKGKFGPYNQNWKSVKDHIEQSLLQKGDINENYSQFRNKTSRRDAPEQLHKAVKEIKKKLQEVDKLVEYTNRLRTEVSEGEGEVKYNTHTTRALEQIQEMIKHTYIKAKKLK